MSKLDVFRHCRVLRHAGNVMIAVVLALLCAVFYAVVSGYADHFSEQKVWKKLVSVLVIASFALVVRSQSSSAMNRALPLALPPLLSPQTPRASSKQGICNVASCGV